jgi:hypothetical protein
MVDCRWRRLLIVAQHGCDQCPPKNGSKFSTVPVVLERRLGLHGAFGRTILSVDAALQFIAHEEYFLDHDMISRTSKLRKVELRKKRKKGMEKGRVKRRDRLD